MDSIRHEKVCLMLTDPGHSVCVKVTPRKQAIQLSCSMAWYCTCGPKPMLDVQDDRFTPAHDVLRDA